MKDNKTTIRFDDSDYLILCELSELTRLSKSDILNTILKVYLKQILDENGNISKDIRKKFAELNNEKFEEEPAPKGIEFPYDELYVPNEADDFEEEY